MRKYHRIIAVFLVTGLLSGCMPGKIETGEYTLEPAEEVTAPDASQEGPSPYAEATTEAPTESFTEVPTETFTEPTVSPNIGLTALAVVPKYVNVRTGPSTEVEIVG